MAYQHLRPQPTAPDQPAASPQPNGESMVELFQRTGKLPLDARAGDGYSQADHARAKEIRFAMSEGRWYAGNSIPHRLMPLVYPDGLPESFQQGRQAVAGSTIAASFDVAGGGDVAARLARKIEASLATDSPASRRDLATDQRPRPRNDLAPDNAQLRRPTMSYKLAQVMGDYQLLDEDSFDESMQQWGITEPRDRIGLKAEATALGMMRPRGTPITMAQKPRQYHPMPGMDDTKTQHFVRKDSKEPTKSTAGNPLTIQACTKEGYAAYDRTSIDL